VCLKQDIAVNVYLSIATRPRLDESGILWISPSVAIISKKWEENDSIRSVRFKPNSRPKEIRWESFRGWRNLKSVSIPNSVEQIYANAQG
jgi:hypothetical protein